MIATEGKNLKMASAISAASGLDRAGILDFNKPLLGQLPASLSSFQRLALCVREFSSLNRRQVSDGGRSSKFCEPLSKLIDFCDFSVATVTDPAVIVENSSLKLYRDALLIWPDVLAAPNVGACETSKADETILNLVNDFFSSSRRFDFEQSVNEFTGWLLCEFGIPCSAVGECVESPSLPGIVAYSDFSSSLNTGAMFLLDLLLVGGEEDVFIARQVDELLSRFLLLKRVPIQEKATIVENWFRTRPTELTRRAAVADFFTKFVTSAEFQHTDCLTLLRISTVPRNIFKIHQWIPGLVALPGSTLKILQSGHWRILLGWYVAAHGNDLILKSLDIIFKEQESANMWDLNSVIPRHFGQLGIGIDNPVMALFESGILENVDAKLAKSEIVKFFILGLVFLHTKNGQHVDTILHWFPQVGDADVASIGLAVLERVFHPIIATEAEKIEVSILASAISLCACILAKAEVPHISSYLETLFVIRFCALGREKFPSFLTIPETILESTPVGRPAVVDWLVKVLFENPEMQANGSTLGHALGITPVLNEQMIKQLLTHSFDADIEFFLDHVSSERFSNIVTDIVTSRMAVLVRRLVEDTSRLHGIVVAIIPGCDLIFFISQKFDFYVQKNVTEWIMSGDDLVASCTEVADSCKRLLHHSSYIVTPESRRLLETASLLSSALAELL